MDKHNFSSLAQILGLCAALLSIAGCGGSAGSSGGVASSTQPLTAACSTPAAPGPSGAWMCPNSKTVECTGGGVADVDTLYLTESAQLVCAGQHLNVSEAGPFAVGPHTITVSDDQHKALCSAQLNVVDTQPPVLTEHTINLWPPNHKMHGLAVSDCVSATDACEGELQGEFIWASSDEPVDSIGDGHTGPDVGFTDARHACVRSERQGPKNGRIYKLGARVVDASGHAAEGSCTVIVDHDQRGTTGQDSGEAYRVTWNGVQNNSVCEGAAGAAGGGGTGGAAGAGGSAGTSGAGGAAGTSGTGGAGGAAGTSGTSGAGGAAGTSGTSGAGGSAGTSPAPVDAGAPF